MDLREKERKRRFEVDSAGAVHSSRDQKKTDGEGAKGPEASKNGGGNDLPQKRLGTGPNRVDRLVICPGR